MNKDTEQGVKIQKLDLKLTLSPPMDSRSNKESLSLASPSSYFSLSSARMSSPSSCISSDLNLENQTGSDEDQNLTVQHPDRPEASSMVIVGCPRCLMYVMLAEEDPKCPKCKNTSLLSFHEDSYKKTKNS